MTIHKLTFENIEKFYPDLPGLITFSRPLRGRAFRIYRLPPTESDSGRKELEETLNTVCASKKDGVWYFAPNPDAMADIIEILNHMGYFPITVCLGADQQLYN